jgi:hypothetical protein
VIEGARRRSAGLDSRSGPVVLGWKLGVPGQHLAHNILYPGFVVNFTSFSMESLYKTTIIASTRGS